MKKDRKRTARKELSKKVDIMKPINIFEFGSESDPCFGKFYDPRVSECSRCGDSELCALKMGQLNLKEREKIEKTQAFKDLEERSISEPDKKIIKTKMKSRIKELITIAGKGGITEKAIINDLFTTYSKEGFSKTQITKFLAKIVSKSTQFEFNKNQKLVLV